VGAKFFFTKLSVFITLILVLTFSKIIVCCNAVLQ